MPISKWPEHERPREKLLQRGPAALSDAELLAIFIRSGVPGKTAVDVARDLLSRYGGLRALLAAGREELCETPGLGEAKYVQLQASLEMGRRFLAEKLKRDVILGSTRDTKDFLQAQLRDRKSEVFGVLFLDNRHRVLAFEELFQGTLNGTAVYPREIIKRALELHATAIIMVHNHPSGDPTPSSADIDMTKEVRDAGEKRGIVRHDHVIVARAGATSFRSQGLL
jgi:DNA repair protein RadC